MDATSVRRQFAYTLPDRRIVYYSNPIGGNKPVTTGRQYSMLAFLPEKAEAGDGSWYPPC